MLQQLLAGVASDESGYIRFIDTRRVTVLAKQYHVSIRVLRRVGQFVPAGVPLLMVSKGNRPDGYQIEVVRSAGKRTLYSRRQNVLNQKFPYIAATLNDLPEGTVLDGELVALGPDGRPGWRGQTKRSTSEFLLAYRGERSCPFNPPKKLFQ
jgi:Predicted membrane protein (DUF2254)